MLRVSLPALGAALAMGALGAVSCDSGTVPDPFPLLDGGFDATGGFGGQGAGPSDAGPDTDPTLGGPCTDDGQCDDHLPCTFDKCDKDLDLCRFTPDDSTCQNGVFCDGVEVCDQKLGCRAGEPMGCADLTPCTLDSCDEATRSCKHEPRDIDQDGDPDIHCTGGGDCDDNDPTVSSIQPEICGNLKDDDCDSQVDESSCTSPEHDTCLDPLEITQSGSYAMNTTAAHFDYASSCALPNPAQQRDVVGAIELAAGPPVDVEITARTSFADVAVTLAGQCGDAATEIACGGPFPAPTGGKLAKLRGRAVGSATEAVALPVYVNTETGTPVTLDVQILPPEPVPTNETCGTADPITPGIPELAYILEAQKDLGSVCTAATGDLVYSFTLSAPANVDVYASSVDGDGTPSISLRGPGCALPTDEITCQTAQNAHLFWQSLPAATYYVAVSASAPTQATVTVELSPPTPPGPDESCTGAPIIDPNVTIDVDVAGHQDDVALGCMAGAPDAAYELDLGETSDVLLVERIAMGDTGAIELSQAACAGPQDLLACGTGSISPVRSAKHAVPAGSYRVVAESLQAKGTQVTAFVRPAVAPVLVPFADGCADAFAIPPTGGFFQGTTANASANFNAGCDQGGLPQGGAPEQLLELTLAVPKRVVLDMAGSAYTTLLDVREGPACPGKEVLDGCAVGYYQDRSFLDLTLGAGTYYIQIDGYALESGPWFLDVRVVDL